MRRILTPIFLLLAMLLLASPAAAQRILEDPPSNFRVVLLGEDEAPLLRSGPFRVMGLDDKPGLKDSIERTAVEARARLYAQARVDWEGTALIVWVEDEQEFLRNTGHRPEHTSAAASAIHHTVWINASQWRRASPRDNLKVMTHELGHLMVGNLPGGRPRLPLWAEEGLVQHLAGEWDFTRSALVARHHFFGRVPSLAELDTRFPDDPEARSLAYALGYLAVKEVAEAYGDEPGSVTRFMRRLSDANAGPRLNEDLWSAVRIRGFDELVRQSMGTRATSALIMLSSGTTLWIVAVVLLVAGWWRRRRMRLEREASEARADSWAESLTQADIQDIYGDREGRFDEVEESPWERHQRELEDNDDHAPWRG